MSDLAREIAEELYPMLPKHEAFPARREVIEGAREHAMEIVAAAEAEYGNAIYQLSLIHI